jgi:hypothetical protein
MKPAADARLAMSYGEKRGLMKPGHTKVPAEKTGAWDVNR